MFAKKIAVICCLLVVVLSVALLTSRSGVQAQGDANRAGGFQNYAPTSSDLGPVGVPRPLEVPELYAFERGLENGLQQVTLVDSESKRICVYHIDPQGKIEFVANRSFEWDLKMDDFNGVGLSPHEIRDAVERRSGGR